VEKPLFQALFCRFDYNFDFNLDLQLASVAGRVCNLLSMPLLAIVGAFFFGFWLWLCHLFVAMLLLCGDVAAVSV